MFCKINTHTTIIDDVAIFLLKRHKIPNASNDAKCHHKRLSVATRVVTTHKMSVKSAIATEYLTGRNHTTEMIGEFVLLYCCICTTLTKILQS